MPAGDATTSSSGGQTADAAIRPTLLGTLPPRSRVGRRSGQFPVRVRVAAFADIAAAVRVPSGVTVIGARAELAAPDTRAARRASAGMVMMCSYGRMRHSGANRNAKGDHCSGDHKAEPSHHNPPVRSCRDCGTATMVPQPKASNKTAAHSAALKNALTRSRSAVGLSRPPPCIMALDGRRPWRTANCVTCVVQYRWHTLILVHRRAMRRCRWTVSGHLDRKARAQPTTVGTQASDFSGRASAPDGQHHPISVRFGVYLCLSGLRRAALPCS